MQNDTQLLHFPHRGLYPAPPRRRLPAVSRGVRGVRPRTRSWSNLSPERLLRGPCGPPVDSVALRSCLESCRLPWCVREGPHPRPRGLGLQTVPPVLRSQAGLTPGRLGAAFPPRQALDSYLESVSQHVVSPACANYLRAANSRGTECPFRACQTQTVWGERRPASLF